MRDCIETNVYYLHDMVSYTDKKGEITYRILQISDHVALKNKEKEFAFQHRCCRNSLVIPRVWLYEILLL